MVPKWDQLPAGDRALTFAAQQALRTGYGQAFDGPYLITAEAYPARRGCYSLVVSITYEGMLSERQERLVCQ